MKTLIFPLTYNCREIIKFSSMLVNLGDLILVTKDKVEPYYEKLIKSSSESNITITYDFDNAISKCDCMLLLEGEKNVGLYFEKMKQAVDNNKRILMTRSFQIKYCNQFRYEKLEILDDESDYNDIAALELLNIDIPVIGVMGLGKYCDKFICELSLRQYFLNLGYKVLQYGSKETSPIFGFDSIPKYILDTKISMEKRAANFNHQVVNRIQTEKPDLLIVGVSEGIMPLNHKNLNNFGENALLISNALSIDYSILGVYYQEIINSDFVRYLEGSIKYKFSSELAGICISSTAYESITESFGKEFKYYHFDVDNNMSLNTNVDYPINFFKTSSLDCMQKAFSDIHSNMTENIDVL